MRILGIIASSVQKAFAIFSDNFNRTTSGELGTSSSGGLWKALRGVWFANGSAAETAGAANTYPIANIDMTEAGITASITTGAWSTISTTGTVGSITSRTLSGSTFYTATITGMSSTTGMAIGQRIMATNGTGSLFGGTPDFIEITAVNSSTSITYRTKNGTTPTAGTVTNIQSAGNDGGGGIAIWITDSGNWWGISYGRAIDNSCNCTTCQQSSCSSWGWTTSYSCTGWTNYASYTCTGTTNYQNANTCATYGFTSSSTYTCVNYTPTYACNAYQYATPYYCALYQVGVWGNTCAEWVPSVTCSGWQVSGSSCAGPEWTTTTWGYQCSTWNAGSWSPACSSWSTSYAPSCSSTSQSWGYQCTGTTWSFTICNCQTCYPPYIRVIQSTSNAVSEITRWTLSSMAAAFKVITNSATKAITIRPYRDTSMTSQIGSDLTYTATSATISKKFGIVLAPSDNIQGSKLDDFNIQSN